MSLISIKQGKVFTFKRIGDNKEDILKYDISENKFYKLGKQIAESTAKKFFSNLDINDFINSCDSQELKNFIIYIYKNENYFDSRISNIGTFLCRIDKYKTREKLAVLGIYPQARILYTKDFSISDIPLATREYLEYSSNRFSKLCGNYMNSGDKEYYNNDYKNKFISKFYENLIESDIPKEDLIEMFKTWNQAILLKNSGRFSHLRNIESVLDFLLFNSTKLSKNSFTWSDYSDKLPSEIGKSYKLFEAYKKYNITLVHLIGYIHYIFSIEDIKPSEFISIYVDTLNMGYNLNRLVKYPKHLKSIHDINMKYTNMINKPYDNSVFKELLLQNSKYEKTVTHNKLNVSFWLPEDYESINKEAIALNHCVSSYIEDYMNKKCVLVFMRKNDDLYTPYVTLEILDNTITQARGSFHRVVSNEELKCIEKYAKLLDLKLNINMEE